MKKRNLYKYFIPIFLFLVAGKMSFAQTYNNEWIVYGKPYYKFKILNDGMYRITGATLSSLGITATGAQLQLWRNGVQIPVYVNNTGTLGSADYIEFYGQHNDGSVDAGLFQQPSDQLNKGKCLETDSCTYFLTVNTNTAQNFQFNNNAAPSSTGGLTPEPYFMYTVQNNNLGTSLNSGPAVMVSNEPVYSSDYQYKTFGVSISSGGSTSTAFSNLYPYTASGVSSTFSVGVAGISSSNRTVNVSLSSGGTIINGQTFTGYGGQATGTGFQVTGNITATIKETSSAGDNCVVSFASLTYPRLYNFNNQSYFAFNLKASTAQRLLQITNFNANGATPVLYDLTNKQRYTALVSGGNYQFVLPAMDSATLVMAAQSASSYTSITATQIIQRNFVDVTNAGNQGNFLIITHPTLLTGAQSYQQYRISAAGGGYSAKIYTIDDLEDEFAFGIRNHPLSVKNFILYARNKFSVTPQYAFIIGHGLTFDETQGANASNPAYQTQALVPTFGYPASDILLAANAFSPVAAIPIGRLTAISNQEISNYLNKIQTYEQFQQTDDYTIANNLWKKNMAYVAGGGSAVEEPNFAGSLSNYEQIMQDTLFGGFGYNFSNYGSFSTQSSNTVLSSLFTNGMSLISYYGHGSSTVIGYPPLSSPSNFTYTGKYPVIFTSGCDLGACFSYVAGRSTALTNMTELYLLSPNVGAAGFVAQTNLGVTGILDLYDIPMYKSLSNANYGKAIPLSMIQGENGVLSSNNIVNLANAAQTIFLGDPSISLYHFSKPDFAVEASQIIMPATASITDANYSVKVYLYNIGQYVRAQDSVLVQIQKTSPTGVKTTLLSKYIPSIAYMDSVQITVPISPNTDAGNNTITVTIDGDQRYNEITYSNNSASQSIQIYSNGITPVYPYNYAIIHNSTQHLFASTSNALAPSATYIMQMDTTVLFNSPSLITKNITSIGGVLEFNPGITYTDSTVYYWRTSPAPSAATNNIYNWANSSFQYIGSPNISDGLGQSHVYQHLADSLNGLNLDSTGYWGFGPRPVTVVVNHALESPAPNTSAILIQLNGATYSSYFCTSPGNSIMFNVFDPNSFYPYYNESPAPTTTQYVADAQLGGYMGSVAACGSSPYSYDRNPASKSNRGNFQFPIQTLAQRNTVVQFMNWIPDGAYVVARIFVNNASTMPYVSTWQADGTDTSTLYAHFIGQGLTTINDFTSAQPLFFIYKKNGHGFTPYQELNVSSLSINVNASDSLGYATSPIFGPALQWTSMQWNGRSLENPSTANAQVSIIGYDSSKTVATTLMTGITISQANTDISSISASKYPYLQLAMRNADSINFVPYQLHYWHLLYTPVPEGALAPNANPSGMSDTVATGQDYKFSIAFKNVSDQPFADSIIATAKIVSANNSTYNIPVPNLKKLVPGDTSTVFITIPGDTSVYNQTISNPLFKAAVPTTSLMGANSIYLNINPKFAQPEETLINNNLIKNLYVKNSTSGAALDVTFDGVHILNNDIVAAKPDIQIHLTSNSKYVLLTDTSVVQVSLKFPDGTTHRYYFSNSDTISFTPAKDSSNNEALIDLRPYLTQDGTYQLIVTGLTNNTIIASQSYTVSFQVINKPMISDMFNYPNPFTSSTAFVFTITGSVVPQNIRIEILTITGKIVKEITEAELGNIHVGRNVTDYKWDGTDMYGQKLANGVYLFRVITNEDGKSLDKYNLTDQNGVQVNTGKYFNKGYGKMYLMR